MSQLYQKVKRWAIVWLARRLPACKEITRWVSDSLDQRLSLRQRIEIRLHLLICIWCERYKQQLLFIRAAMHHASARVEEGDEPFPTSPLSPEARDRINRSLSRQDQ